MCLLSVICASGLFIDASLIHANQGEVRGVFSGEAEWHKDHWDATLSPKLDTSAQNPYVRIAIGHQIDWLPQLSTRLDYSHESSIATGRDRGVEKISLSVQWRPFR